MSELISDNSGIGGGVRTEASKPLNSSRALTIAPRRHQRRPMNHPLIMPLGKLIFCHGSRRLGHVGQAHWRWFAWFPGIFLSDYNMEGNSCKWWPGCCRAAVSNGTTVDLDDWSSDVLRAGAGLFLCPTLCMKSAQLLFNPAGRLESGLQRGMNSGQWREPSAGSQRNYTPLTERLLPLTHKFH